MADRNGSSIEDTLNEIENLNKETPRLLLTAFSKAITTLIGEMAKLEKDDQTLQRCKKIFDLFKSKLDIKTQFVQDKIRHEIKSSLQQAVLEVQMNSETTEAADEDAKKTEINKEALKYAENRIEHLKKGLDLNLSDLFSSISEDILKEYVTAACTFLFTCEEVNYPSELFKVEYAPDQKPNVEDDLNTPIKEGEITDKCLEFFKPLITHKEILIGILNDRLKETKKTLTDTSNQQQPESNRQFFKKFLKNPLSPFFVIISGARDKNNNNRPKGTVIQTGTRTGCVEYCQNEALKLITSASSGVTGRPLFSLFSLR